jgi:hypothetical protein
MKMFKAIAVGYDGSKHYTSEFANYGKLLDFVYNEFSGWDVISHVDLIDVETDSLVDVMEMFC